MEFFFALKKKGDKDVKKGKNKKTEIGLDFFDFFSVMMLSFQG